jgi:hypothetical protein
MATLNTPTIQTRNGINGIVTLILRKPSILRDIIHIIHDILDIMVTTRSILSLSIHLTTGTILSLILLTVHSNIRLRNIQLTMRLRNSYQ